MCRNMVWVIVFVSAELPATSPRKITHFWYLKAYLQDERIPKVFNIILNAQSLVQIRSIVPTSCSGIPETRLLAWRTTSSSSGACDSTGRSSSSRWTWKWRGSGRRKTTASAWGGLFMVCPACPGNPKESLMGCQRTSWTHTARCVFSRLHSEYQCSFFQNQISFLCYTLILQMFLLTTEM